MTTTPQTNASLEEIARVIREHDNFALCGHVNPDGDCLGSQLALHHSLQALGKTSTCLLVRDEAIGSSLQFLPGVQNMQAAANFDMPIQVFIALDVPVRERIGAAARVLDGAELSIAIDHHAADTRMCDFAYIDPDSASASLLVWRLVKLLLDNPPLESALCAYTGLVTDTGGFCFQNCNAEALAVASELVAFGVNPADVAMHVFQSRSLASLNLEALAIERLRVLSNGAGALSWVSREDLERFNASKSDVEPLINVVRSLDAVRVGCVLREQDGIVKGSIRSKDNTDVSMLARELGGGGHRAAAGFSLEMPIEQAVEFMSEKICELLKS